MVVQAFLVTIPAEILRCILGYVSSFDILQLQASCRFLHQTVREDRTLWYFHGMGARSEGFAGYYRRNFKSLIKMAKNINDQVMVVNCAFEGLLSGLVAETVMHSLLLPFLLEAILKQTRVDAWCFS